MKKAALCVRDTLRGVSFEKVETSMFKDQNGADARIAPRKFYSLDHMRSCLNEQAEKCKVFVLNIWEYDFGGGRGPEYWVYCAFRK